MMVLTLIDNLFWIYMLMLFIRILSSWVPELRDTRFIQFVSYYTDPYLNLFRRVIPPVGMFDLSPIVAFFALHIIERFVKSFFIWLIF